MREISQERLLESVEFDTNGGCWLWNKSTVPGGYGKVKVKRKDVLAHRASWKLINGPIAEGMIVRHKCDVPACINPDHLLVGTLSDNSQDAIRRGRHRSGSSWPRLSEQQIEIVTKKISDGWKDGAIAKLLGVSRNSVGRRRRKMMKVNQ